MAREAVPHGDSRTTKQALKQKRQGGKQPAVKSSGKKTPPAVPDARHDCLIIGNEGCCPEWQELLAHYPMIDSVQREDFQQHGASFVYLAHFYRTGDTARESSCAKKQFRNFFRSIGYTFDSAGNFKSRWFEGIGVRIR